MATVVPAASGAPPKLRVLCLHGFRTNVQVMQDQTRALRQALGPHAEFVFLNGPFEAEGESDPTIERRYADTAPFYEWWRLLLLDGATADLSSDENTARATEYISKLNWFMRFGGLDETLAYMDAQLRALGPFDVAVGFSQGSILLTVLSMWYAHHERKRWWSLVVCVCGMRVGGVNVKYLFETPGGDDILVPMPSVHVIGRRDPLFAMSHRLADMYELEPAGSPSPRVVFEHDEGHKFPSPKLNPQFYADLVRLIEQHCGDFGAPTAAVATTAVTPPGASSRL